MPTEPLVRTLARARARWLARSILARSVETLTAAVAGVALLLILGAEILDWRWIGALVAAAFAVGVYRVITGLPDPYRILQEVDRRLGLQDALSTAFYYRQKTPVRHGLPEGIRQAQRRQAERLAQEADVRRAIPIAAPRALYLLAVLAVLAGSLFALRYGVTRRLDLRPPLAAILFPGPESQPTRQAKAQRRAGINEKLKRWLEQAGIPLKDTPIESDGAAPPQHTATAAETTEFTAAARRPDFPKPVPLTAGEELGDDGAGDPSEQVGEAAGESSETGGPGRDSSARSNSPWPPENSNLLEQFREALANLLERLKSRPSSGQSDLTAKLGNDGAESANSRRSQSEKSAPGPGRQSEGDAVTEGDGREPSDGAEEARSAAGKPGGRDPDLQPAREGRSGIGKEDGRKDTREAEQLAAMGKLTELFGRRQATLTGEVTVEVTSGTQKLRTPYSEQQARHAEAGGEIHRDEVPLLFQHYVQRYFEEVRKSLPPAPRPGSAATGNGEP